MPSMGLPFICCVGSQYQSVAPTTTVMATETSENCIGRVDFWRAKNGGVNTFASTKAGTPQANWRSTSAVRWASALVKAPRVTVASMMKNGMISSATAAGSVKAMERPMPSSMVRAAPSWSFSAKWRDRRGTSARPTATPMRPSGSW